VKNNNSASARGAKRAELQKTHDDLERQFRELQAEGRRELDRFCNSPIFEPPSDDPTYVDWVARHEFLDRIGAVTEQWSDAGRRLEIFDSFPKPGRLPTQTEKDRQLRQECLQDFPDHDDESLAIRRFVTRRGGDPRRAANVWSLLKSEDEK
jgi:hypothetical protein